MDKENAKKLAEAINDFYLGKIQKAIFDHLYVSANLAAAVTRGADGEYYVELLARRDGMNVTELLTDNLLLRKIFKSGYLYAFAYWQRDARIAIQIGIEYKHPRGGSNGLTDILNILINIGTQEIEKID